MPNYNNTALSYKNRQTNVREFKKTTTATTRQRHQTKGFMSRTMAVHVHYNSWYIALDHALSICNACNRCLFSFPFEIEMAEEQEYL